MEGEGTVSKDSVVEGLGKSLGWSNSPSLCPTPSPSLPPPSLRATQASTSLPAEEDEGGRAAGPATQDHPGLLL